MRAARCRQVWSFGHVLLRVRVGRVSRGSRTVRLIVPIDDVFKQLDSRLDGELKKWTQLKTEEVPKIAALIRQVELPAISVGEKP